MQGKTVTEGWGVESETGKMRRKGVYEIDKSEHIGRLYRNVKGKVRMSGMHKYGGLLIQLV